MKNTFLVFGFLSLVVACTGSLPDSSEIGETSSEVTLDVRCAADSDCPAGFECEIEVEHGVTTSFCKSHGGGHGGHGGHSSSGHSSSSGSSGHSSSSSGHSSSSSSSSGHSSSSSSSSSSGSSAGSCTTDADCPAGQECEIETEHGVTTSFCKAHGGGHD